MNNEKQKLLRELWAMEKANPITKISMPSDTLPLLQKYATKKQEHFIVITLDGQHALIKIRVITKGLVNRTIVHPREVFRPAIADNATSIIIAHNHPSGNLEKSPEDEVVTQQIREAGKILGINMLDHIIISKGGYFSFLESGCL
jgi:DNA repair protein RadC